MIFLVFCQALQSCLQMIRWSKQFTHLIQESLVQVNSIPDVFSASRPKGNSKIAYSVDEIHDLLRDYFVGFVDYDGE